MQDIKKLISDLKAQERNLERELAKVRNAIAALEPAPMLNMNWKKRAIECLNEWQTYSQTTQILNCVFFKENMKVEDKLLKRRYTTALSIALNDMCKDNLLFKFTIGGIKGDHYGLRKWFNINGEFKNEYMDEELKSMLEEYA